jgi:hypothetical protein
MFNLSVYHNGQDYNNWDNISFEDLVIKLVDTDHCWLFCQPRSTAKTTRATAINEDDFSATIEFCDDDARAKWKAFVAKVKQNNNVLIKNEDDIGTAPVFTLLDQRVTSWDYKWDQAHPDYNLLNG